MALTNSQLRMNFNLQDIKDLARGSTPGAIERILDNVAVKGTLQLAEAYRELPIVGEDDGAEYDSNNTIDSNLLSGKLSDIVSEARKAFTKRMADDPDATFTGEEIGFMQRLERVNVLFNSDPHSDRRRTALRNLEEGREPFGNGTTQSAVMQRRNSNLGSGRRDDRVRVAVDHTMGGGMS